MTANKTPATYRAYCVLRAGGRRRTGRWIETGAATVAPEGWIMVRLETLPVSGFDGNILLKSVDAKSGVPLPQPDDDEDDETGYDISDPATFQ